MANPVKAAELAAVAAKVTTIGAARAALGECTRLLQAGYAKINQADLWDEDELKEACRDRLDVVNAYAQGIYATIGTSDPDLQAEEISALNCSRVGLVIAQTDDALSDIDEAINENTFDVAGTLKLALAIAGETAGSAVQSVTNAVAAGGAAFIASAWPTLVIGAAAVGLVLWIRAGRPGLGGV